MVRQPCRKVRQLFHFLFDNQPEFTAMATSAEGFGCSHYKRKCQLVAPCCDRVYTCRFCHNEKETHELNRKDVKEISCLKCATRQKVRHSCISCGTVFGKYFCAICRLFDDEDKEQFHCDGCGICRVGGRQRFFHCKTCDMCLSIKLKETHKCVEKASRSNCPVCLEDLHSSRNPSHVPPCGHLIHRNCFEELLSNGNYACPLCAVSMVNMKPVWETIDEEVATTPMPLEFADKHVGILCRDCHKESVIKFHVVGLKCEHCGSYNTCRTNYAPEASSEGQRVSRRQSLQALLLELVGQLGQQQQSRARTMRAF